MPFNIIAPYRGRTDQMTRQELEQWDDQNQKMLIENCIRGRVGVAIDCMPLSRLREEVYAITLEGEEIDYKRLDVAAEILARREREVEQLEPQAPPQVPSSRRFLAFAPWVLLLVGAIVEAAGAHILP